MSFLWGLLQLARPLNGLITWAAVVVGAVVARQGASAMPVALAGLSAALIASGGNALNDFSDVATDRINKPHRPIPSGRVSRGWACGWAVSLFAAGLWIAGTLSPAAFCVAVAAIALLVTYSWRLKRTPYWGNATVSLVSGMAFVYGGLAVSHPAPALVPGVLAFLFHCGREIIKDVEDAVGDASVSAQTAPLRYGKKTALTAATAVLCLLVGATLFPFWLGLYGPIYLAIVLLAVDPVLFYVILSMWRDSTPETLAKLSLVLKADMPIGLLAVILGTL
jgi:geranylgeranylglycerol-phosphate geranylgeranyltransferase